MPPTGPGRHHPRRSVRLGSVIATTTVVLAGLAAASPAAAATPATSPAAGAAPSALPGAAAYAPTIRPLAVNALATKLGIGAPAAERLLAAQAGSVRLTTTLERTLGNRLVGTYLDAASGQLVVNVTDSAAATTAAGVGTVPRLVSRSAERLREVQAALDRTGTIPGTSWGIDQASNTVTVEISPTAARDSRTAAWVRSLATYGAAVQVRQTSASYRTQAFYGGQAIVNASGSGRCSAAFNAYRGSQSYVITAGHCTEAISTWSTGSQTIGTSQVARFPGDDYGTVLVSNPTALDPRPAVLSGSGTQPITGYSQVPVGASVCKTGSTTGTTCGTVQAYNVTVVYAEGRVRGLIRTNLCTQPGDSGGALFAGNQAQGIVSGGTAAGCEVSGFVSFFQPVAEALRVTGLTLRTS